MVRLHWIDWTLVIIPLIGLLILALYTRRFVRNVADFIAAGRCAGRYLLANAGAEAGSGVTNTVANIEKLFFSGFCLLFWEQLTVPIALIMGISGFAVYRYRETRCLTVAQFFEMRYSRPFRLFMGILAFLAGILNYGVFPAVSARFFIYFLGMSEYVKIAGFDVPTVTLIMGAYLSLSVMLILFGGQITLIVTDCVEGIFTHLVYLIIILVLVTTVSWRQVLDVLTGTPPRGAPAVAAQVMHIEPQHSPVDPFDAFKVKNFNGLYTLLGALMMVYGVMSWQGGHGFRAAARTAHEGRMANVLGQWRIYARGLVLLVLVICTMTFLRHPDFAAKSLEVKKEVAQIPSPGERVAFTTYAATPEQIASQKWVEDKGIDGATGKRNVPQLQQQQLTTVTLRHLLPTGVRGLFLLIMILGLFAGDGSHLISWSSIFIQDVVMPLRGGRPLAPASHLRLLRYAAIGTAIWAFLFSWLFALEVDIWMWWAITGVVYTAGAGAVIIAGLYWSRGTAAGAWTAMSLGSTLGLGAILAKKLYPGFFAELGARCPSWFDLSSENWHGFLIMLTAASSYVIISLLTCKEPFDMDWLLKRGKYRIASDHMDEHVTAKVPLLQRLIGVDHLFSRTDRFVSGFIFWWSILCVSLNVSMVFWHYVMGHYWPSVQMDKNAWAHFWLFYGLIIPFLFALVTLAWFGIGGMIDIKHFFHALKTMERGKHDDGSVEEHGTPQPGFEVVMAKEKVPAMARSK